MSSSTSSSDPGLWPASPEETKAWRGFSVRAVVSAALISAGLLGIFVALDPYDTGRLALVHKRGVTETGGRLGDASRIHDEDFDSAVFGNSHIMPLQMGRLSSITGLKWMMLAVEGTGVPEQMTMLDAYLARHSPPKALIIGVDWVYCTEDPRVRAKIPFPHWLYTPERWRYVRGLFQGRTLEVMGRRLMVLAGLGRLQTRDGNVDIYDGNRHTPEEASRLITTEAPQDFSRERSMPAFAMLKQRLDRLSPSTAVILVLPPVAAVALPSPGTPAAAADQACRDHAHALVESYPNRRVVDWRRRTALTADLGNFWDSSHYYDVVAQSVERDIGEALASVRGPVEKRSPVMP